MEVYRKAKYFYVIVKLYVYLAHSVQFSSLAPQQYVNSMIRAIIIQRFLATCGSPLIMVIIQGYVGFSSEAF